MQVNTDTDLPLMANSESVDIKHYSLDLYCDLEKNAFYGSLTLQFKLTNPQCCEIILDCCDLEVNTVTSLSSNSCVPLDFDVSSWALKIHCSGTLEDKIRIEYETKQDTRSLHWRLDNDGNPCVYTPAAAVNNRGLFPCQDIPGAMSSWDLTVRLPSDSRAQVFCTGDKHATVTELNGIKRFQFQTAMILPMSTFAIAIGSWETVELSSPVGSVLPIRLIGPKSLIQASPLHQYIPAAVKSAVNLLGQYPLPKLDVLVVSRAFSGLGLASPNLILISPSLLVGADTAPSLLAGADTALIKIAHEICHGWFGIMVGSKDWTEAWLSEGFATFLEDIVHGDALRELGLRTHTDLVKLRAMLKYTTLKTETENVSSELQQLRPMKGKKLQDSEENAFVKNGLNPVAGLTQTHYLKGYFLLHFLMESVGDKPFLLLLREYFEAHCGQLVDSTQFLGMFYQKYPHKVAQSLDVLVSSWLDSPGLPASLHSLGILRLEDTRLYSDVMDYYHEVFDLNEALRRSRLRDIEVYSEKLQYPEQVQILLTMLLTLTLNTRLMNLIYSTHSDMIYSNLDLFHVWCELIIINRYKALYSDLRRFLTVHQSMGVYLYFEMTGANKQLKTLAREVYDGLQAELDAGTESILQELFK